MNDELSRPNPDDLLAHIQQEEAQQSRGKLRILLGYVAGVGKTYAMLEEAHELKSKGGDVVIGYVETHGRAETEALVEGLEVIPRKSLEYRGAALTEMDVDAILARRPELVLVDELAHTNAPGSRHPKRYQDVEELLDAGINVYTTLNIQHLESLNDVVAQITGIIVRETVPDRVLDEANEIELIDLPPDELIQRLHEGKVYVPDQAARAIERFFRKGNLTALREMALRRAAERVDEQMRAYMQTRAIVGPWAAADRVVVCVGPSPVSERLVRAGRRLAARLDAEWFVVYVETPAHTRLSDRDRDRIARTLRLAEELGGRAITLSGNNVAGAVIGYARRNNITKILCGKPLRPRWIELLFGSVVEQIIRSSGDIDVYIINSSASSTTDAEERDLRSARRSRWQSYLQESLIIVLGISILGQPARDIIDPTNVVMLYLLAVVIVAVRLGRGPSIFTAVTAVVAFDFFFVPPHLTFAISDAQYVITFAGLLVVGLVISNLAARAREQAEGARRREALTSSSYELSRDLAAALETDAIARVVVRHVGQTFDLEAGVLLPQGDTLMVTASTPGFTLAQEEYAVADWAYRHGQPAGRGTDTLPASSSGRFLPLITADHRLGVLAVKPVERPGAKLEYLLTPDQQRLLEGFCHQSSLAFERVQLADKARQAEVLSATERLQNALLNSISHDLHTPLATITQALTSLKDGHNALDDATAGLVTKALREAARLNRLVRNLLDMTRLDAGVLRLVKEPVEIGELVEAALAHLQDHLEGRRVDVERASHLPLVPADSVLITQVLANLLENAHKYSPPNEPIEVQIMPGEANEPHVEIRVLDRGIGIPPGDLERVFDKFYRVQRQDLAEGTGLGLSICQGIVEAHGGTIRAHNRPGGGTVFTVSLPAAIASLPAPTTG